ncbi:MAG TPA: hypothetical protein VF166_02285 [Gemmatimonadaceae bacterium]
MKQTDLAKLAFALIGILIWGYGERINDPNLRWFGIAVIVVAFLIRFLPGARGRRR